MTSPKFLLNSFTGNLHIYIDEPGTAFALVLGPDDVVRLKAAISPTTPNQKEPRDA